MNCENAMLIGVVNCARTPPLARLVEPMPGEALRSTTTHVVDAGPAKLQRDREPDRAGADHHHAGAVDQPHRRCDPDGRRRAAHRATGRPRRPAPSPTGRPRMRGVEQLHRVHRGQRMSGPSQRRLDLQQAPAVAGGEQLRAARATLAALRSPRSSAACGATRL